MPPVRYNDPCGIARGLNILGDRWALLVVRELMYGPKRFGQLRAGLHAISPNVLSERLRDLESAGLLRHDVLAPPASVPVYDLTSRGQAVKPVLLALGRWGSQEPVTSSAELSVSALLLAWETVFDPDTPVRATFALRIDGEWFQVAVTRGSIAITSGRPEQAVAALMADISTLRSITLGAGTVADAERTGRLVIDGNRNAAGRFPAMFRVPALRC